MEVKEKSRKRELIKTIAIIFLVVLLVLTLFSNTIMNHSLPEVATQRITNGTINARIRGSGAVAATESYNVIINQTREVRTICVKVGDSVEQGDVLFILGDMESAELDAAEEQLETLRTNYQKQLLTLSQGYATEDRDIQKLKEDLEKYTKQQEENKVTDEEIAQAKGELKAAESDLTDYGLMLEELKAQQSDAAVQLSQAEGNVTQLEGQASSLESEIETLQDQLNGSGSGGNVSTDRDIQDAQASLDAANYQWRSDWLAYSQDLWDLFAAAQGQYPALVIPALSPTSEPVQLSAEQQMYLEAFLTVNAGTVSPGTGGSAGAGSGGDDTSGSGGEGTGPVAEGEPAGGLDYAAYQRYKRAYDTLLRDQESVVTAQKTLYRLLEDRDTAVGDAYADRAEIQAKLNEAAWDLSRVQSQLQQAQNAVTQAQYNSDALDIQIKNYEAIQRQQTAYRDELQQTVTELENKKTAYDQATELVESTQRSLEDALTGKDIDKQIDNLDLQTMRDQIARQEEVVEKLKADVIDTEVKANVSGTVTAINVSAGKETTAGSPMATIDVVDRGYTVRISVTSEQARQVKVGDTADVTNYYWGSSLEATLEQIVADPDSQGQRRILVFRVTGDIDPGTNITLSIGQRSANYDTIVPKSALREDSNGHFVLVVTSRSTPLGNRYTATRVDVEVLAEDDTNAAVSGLTPNDYVITTSSAPLSAGTQVRLVEDAA